MPRPSPQAIDLLVRICDTMDLPEWNSIPDKELRRRVRDIPEDLMFELYGARYIADLCTECHPGAKGIYITRDGMIEYNKMKGMEKD